MIHLYKSKHYRDETVVILCSGDKVKFSYGFNEATTVPWNVTCPKCLDILIPRQEDRLAKMKQNRERYKEDGTRSIEDRRSNEESSGEESPAHDGIAP